MTTAFFDSIAFEVYISSSWIDITSDIRSDPPPEWNVGIMDNTPTSRVGDPEFLTFYLNNSKSNSVGLEGYYTPGHSNCRAGWTSGLDVRFVIIFEGETFYKWTGKIMADGITVSPWIYGKRDVKVNCHGFIAQAADHPFDLPELATNVTVDQAMTLLLTNMPIQPLATSFAVGISTFPTAFDTVRKNTTALAEMYKLAMSELSYIYTRGDKTVGQTLVVENRDTRTGASTLLVPLGEEDSGFILQANSASYILQANSTSKIIPNQTENATFENMALTDRVDVAFGKNLTNLVKAETYPRKVDAAATTVLFMTQERILLAAGETKTGVRGDYRDPAAGADYVSGKEMVTPVSGTDYTMFANADGTGTNLTANLVVTATYGTEGVDYTIQNTGGTPGYVYLQARGKGVYIYDVVERVAEDAASQLTHGVKPLIIEMKYQNDPALGEDYANYILTRESSPQMTVERYEMFANKDSNSLLAFLYGEPGTYAPFAEAMTAINGNYFIMGYSAKLINGKYIFWSPVLKNAGQEQGWILETSALEVDTILGTAPFG